MSEPEPVEDILRSLSEIFLRSTVPSEGPPDILLDQPAPGALLAWEACGNMASDWWEAVFLIEEGGGTVALEGWVWISGVEMDEEEDMWYAEARAKGIATGQDLLGGIHRLQSGRFAWIDHPVVLGAIARLHPGLVREALRILAPESPA